MLFFTARQILDVCSPSNFLLTNPVALKATVRQGGTNLLRGWYNLVEDWQRSVAGKGAVGTENFQVGKNIAVTPGEVVFRNDLIELIQYRPNTKKVHQEPVLIIPAWIMKYYILDLSPHNSLVKFLVDQGHTVFMVSWKNPALEDRDLGMDDYRSLGVLEALNTVSEIIPGTKVHGVGYCLGGTLLAIAAAAMAREGDERLKTFTLLAAQTDFTEAGELMLFMNESQVQYLEDMMWEQGYLDTKQMAGAFQLLRSNDLIWSAMVNDYLLGERRMMNDLMAWNADATRMPYRMQSEYLRNLYLNDDLSEGRYRVGGRPINLADIHLPLFAVGTVKDHVAPWRSVYKIHTLTESQELTFVLTSGGHNAGIVSEPGHRGRHYQAATHLSTDKHVDPETWLRTTPKQEGSWWPLWEGWLTRHSSKQVTAPIRGAPEKGYAPLCAAPGTYVLGE
jgi:polyhydroxyalkanoate synthase